MQRSGLAFVVRRARFTSVLVALACAAVPLLASSAARSEPAEPKKHEAEEKAPSKKAGSAKNATKKKTASRSAANGKHAKRAEAKPPKPCVGTPVTVDRTGLERQTLTLVDCHDRPLENARTSLSVLARPWGARKPAHVPTHAASPASHGKTAPPAAEIAPGVRLLDPGLLARVDAIAHRFPGRPISVVSGYRPQSRGSLHQSGRALDLRVANVSNEELVAFCKTLRDTGCGYYPNSSFVHVDVRAPGTGSVTWIDSSGPGEAPHYVKRWPPPPEESDDAALPPEPLPEGQREHLYPDRGTEPRDRDTEPHDAADPWSELSDEHPLS